MILPQGADLAAIRALVRGLLLHMYSGTLDQDIVVGPRAPVQVSVDALLGLAPDAMHEFRDAPTRQAA